MSGALVLSVPRGSLAERLDLRAGDIVVAMNGRPIGDSAEFTRALLAWRAVAGTRVVVYRAGQRQQLMLD